MPLNHEQKNEINGFLLKARLSAFDQPDRLSTLKKTNNGIKKCPHLHAALKQLKSISEQTLIAPADEKQSNAGTAEEYLTYLKEKLALETQKADIDHSLNQQIPFIVGEQFSNFEAVTQATKDEDIEKLFPSLISKEISPDARAELFLHFKNYLVEIVAQRSAGNVDVKSIKKEANLKRNLKEIPAQLINRQSDMALVLMEGLDASSFLQVRKAIAHLQKKDTVLATAALDAIDDEPTSDDANMIRALLAHLAFIARKFEQAKEITTRCGVFSQELLALIPAEVRGSLALLYLLKTEDKTLWEQNITSALHYFDSVVNENNAVEAHALRGIATYYFFMIVNSQSQEAKAEFVKTRITELEALLEKNNTHTLTMVAVALLKQCLNQFDEVKALCEKVLAAVKESPNPLAEMHAHIILGYYYRRRDAKLAEEHFTAVIMCLDHNKQHPLPLDDFRFSVTLCPVRYYALACRGEARKKQKMDTALVMQDYDAVLKTDHEALVVQYHNLVFTLIERGQYNETRGDKISAGADYALADRVLNTINPRGPLEQSYLEQVTFLRLRLFFAHRDNSESKSAVEKREEKNETKPELIKLPTQNEIPSSPPLVLTTSLLPGLDIAIGQMKASGQTRAKKVQEDRGSARLHLREKTALFSSETIKKVMIRSVQEVAALPGCQETKKEYIEGSTFLGNVIVVRHEENGFLSIATHTVSAGDSTGVAVHLKDKEEPAVSQLNQPHILKNPLERDRIKRFFKDDECFDVMVNLPKACGRLFITVDGRDNGVAVTRAIGDHQFEPVGMTSDVSDTYREHKVICQRGESFVGMDLTDGINGGINYPLSLNEVAESVRNAKKQTTEKFSTNVVNTIFTTLSNKQTPNRTQTPWYTEDDATLVAVIVEVEKALESLALGETLYVALNVDDGHGSPSIPETLANQWPLILGRLFYAEKLLNVLQTQTDEDALAAVKDYIGGGGDPSLKLLSSDFPRGEEIIELCAMRGLSRTTLYLLEQGVRPRHDANVPFASYVAEGLYAKSRNQYTSADNDLIYFIVTHHDDFFHCFDDWNVVRAAAFSGNDVYFSNEALADQKAALAKQNSKLSVESSFLYFALLGRNPMIIQSVLSLLEDPEKAKDKVVQRFIRKGNFSLAQYGVDLFQMEMTDYHRLACAIWPVADIASIRFLYPHIVRLTHNEKSELLSQTLVCYQEVSSLASKVESHVETVSWFSLIEALRSSGFLLINSPLTFQGSRYKEVNGLNPLQFSAYFKLPRLAEFLLNDGEELGKTVSSPDSKFWGLDALGVAILQGDTTVTHLFIQRSSDEENYDFSRMITQGKYTGLHNVHLAALYNPRALVLILYRFRTLAEIDAIPKPEARTTGAHFKKYVGNNLLQLVLAALSDAQSRGDNQFFAKGLLVVRKLIDKGVHCTEETIKKIDILRIKESCFPLHAVINATVVVFLNSPLVKKETIKHELEEFISNVKKYVDHVKGSGAFEEKPYENIIVYLQTVIQSPSQPNVAVQGYPDLGAIVDQTSTVVQAIDYINEVIESVLKKKEEFSVASSARHLAMPGKRGAGLRIVSSIHGATSNTPSLERKQTGHGKSS